MKAAFACRARVWLAGLVGCTGFWLVGCLEVRNITTSMIQGRMVFDAPQDRTALRLPWWSPPCLQGFGVFDDSVPVWVVENTDEALCARRPVFPIEYGRTPANFRVLVEAQPLRPGVVYTFGARDFAAGPYYDGGFMLSSDRRTVTVYAPGDPALQRKGDPHAQ